MLVVAVPQRVFPSCCTGHGCALSFASGLLRSGEKGCTSSPCLGSPAESRLPVVVQRAQRVFWRIMQSP
eukprot:4087457-Alexandrium_andersonii.AAC.1